MTVRESAAARISQYPTAMRLPRRWRRRLNLFLALGAAAALLPFILVSALYLHTLLGLGELPQPPAERPLPRLLALGIWEDTGESGARFEVRETWPWTPVLDLTSDRGRKAPDPAGSRAAGRVASLWLASRPRTGMAGWHLRRTVLTVWLTRNRSASELTREMALRSYFGRGAVGVDQAALSYFGRPPGSLTTGEAALLVGLLQSPTRDSPDRRPDLALVRRNRILERWSAAGLITADDLRLETSKPLGVLPPAKPPSQKTAPNPARPGETDGQGKP